MDNFLLFLYISLTATVLIAIGIVAYKLKKSAIRVGRSLDPITQKSKTLKIELSALKRSRLERQRRLESTSPKVRKTNK